MLLVPYLMAAVRMYEEGFATADDIDEGMVASGRIGRKSGRGFYEYRRDHAAVT